MKKRFCCQHIQDFCLCLIFRKFTNFARIPLAARSGLMNLLTELYKMRFEKNFALKL